MIDEIFISFYKTFNKIVNKHTPIITFSKRKIKTILQAMDNQGITNFNPNKNRLYQSGDFEKYKYYRNKICTLIRLVRKVIIMNLSRTA